MVIEWFRSLENKSDLKFFKFDIESFYPSISKELLERSKDFASAHCEISKDKRSVIMQARKSFLFTD